ncbi:Major cardiolipin synthase ClsA [Sinobacterium norvegicum]|uniref:Cardiolipin synthase n=1 Tax=Sinobacterium norvegicum TaxID=1641715 RepID=A0ABN8EI87_9GAMM|nr:cardiolipin synthase [Sinobacterium norvegicum]CAH0992128.1 Major cardiolipin synthase ClsA [Sinobacterium norvegicum]
MFAESQFVFSFEKLLLLSAVATFCLMTSVHAVIYKRNSYSAFGWLTFILLAPSLSALMYLFLGWRGVLVIFPLVGSILYVCLGVNRLSRKFRKGDFRLTETKIDLNTITAKNSGIKRDSKWLAISTTGKNLGYSAEHYCQIDILNSGDQAYPQMLAAIAQAKKSISLFSYIFNDDDTGMAFCQALIAAKNRGIEVRVLIDAVGSHKSRNTVIKTLRKHKIPAKVFMRVLIKTQFSNLRNHRKLLIVDGETAFTGGLNISQLYWPEKYGDGGVIDLHFLVRGYLVNYLQETFANDWAFTTKEKLTDDIWYSDNIIEAGNCIGRVIADGPSFEEERMRWHFLNAINSAHHHIRILTPYFLPDAPISAALCSAALRGVNVEILLPDSSDHSYMDWALRGSMNDMLARGCQFYFSPPPFDHSKLMLIDAEYASIGSANWDERSLRLNYELNIELSGREITEQLHQLFDQKIARAKHYTLKDLNRRPKLQQLRDGITRLFSPYL